MVDAAFFILVCLAQIDSVRGNTVRLTMVTPTPYGAGGTGSSASFTCFRSGPDTGITLSFGRPFQIGIPGSTIRTFTSLPAGSTESTTGQAVTQYLTTSNDATGLFYCEGTNRGLTTRVYSIVHSVHRHFEPADGLVTKTINKGEGVTLSVTPHGGLATSPVWRQISIGGFDDINDWAGQGTQMLQVASSEARDGDLYAVIQSGLGLDDNHFSMIRLIVRGCVAGRWGPPACVGVCDMCYNGGVCDDETGNCICPPGFSGQNCLNACGIHRFGWDCEFQCGPGNVIESCVGSQFGLPDPYGNSCISGYKGRFCNAVCPTGMFGAGCTQTCRCMSGTCDRFTGECTGTPSGCLAGWSGTSCQIEGTCPVDYFGLDCLSECHCSNDAACERDSGYCSGSDGACASGFISDMNTMNCQTGITAFQMLAKTNPGQDVIFNCTATSGDDLSADSLVLFAGGPYLTYIHTRTEGNMLINTFSVSSLHQDNVISCLLFRNSMRVTSNMLSVSFYALPYLSQTPSIIAESTSAIVSWEAWGSNPMDTGDGPVITYRVYYSPATSPLSLTVAGEIPETDPPQPVYSFKVEPLQPSAVYTFNVAAVREGPGGEGPRSPMSDYIQILLPPALTTSVSVESSTTKFATSSVTPASTFSTEITTLHTEAETSAGSGPKTATDAPQMSTPPLGERGINTTVIAVISVVFASAVVLVVCIYFLRIRRRNRRPTSNSQRPAAGQELTTYENEIPLEDEASPSDYERVGHEQPSPYEKVGLQSLSPYEDVGLPTWVQPWSIAPKNMIFGEKVLGSCDFGEVHEGALMVGGEVFKAAITKLKANASASDRQRFMEELRTMTEIGPHPNVVGLLGACQHEEGLYVAMEYLPKGDLRSYLRRARSTDDISQSSLASKKLIHFAWDVAKGMQHLAAAGVIHRDLAARNILLDDNLVAKVSDFGLSKGEDIYLQTSKTRVPVRWLSLESLTSKTYTSKSDVWSFGVLLWEIATLGATPYEGIKTQNLLSRLENGYRLPKPNNCDDKIYELMLQCWHEDPSARPHFKKLTSVLKMMADNHTEHTYMRLLPKADTYMYLKIRPEMDDN